MRFRFMAAMVATAVLGAPAVASAAPTTMSPLVGDPSAYVDPLIGTGRGGSSVGEINNFPGPRRRSA
ncbi:hypothetical protein ACIA5G_20920 [Amycolatopsis sp. NPDC051758]|uniref:hypothetical protein n=1 Tax=Amycolatopsis sp. NPDC051758 TaxID=3363935 RepID=UPI00378FD6EF